MAARFVPDAGDVVWLHFDPQLGHEQAGHRPALVLSPAAYNEKTGFMSPRMANGNWVEPFDPQLSGGFGSRAYFAENNAWIWNFSVMHDILGLIGMMGGKDQFTGRLDQLFNEPTKNSKWMLR